MRRVVITGIGIYSCIGIGKKEVLESLKSGKCGIISDKERLNKGFRSPLTSNLPEPNIPRPLQRFMADESKYAYVAALEALTDSEGLTDCGVIIGNDSSSRAMAESIDLWKKYTKTSKLGPTHVIKTLNSNPTAVITNLLKLRGTSFSIGGACASGGHAIGVAYSLVKQGIEPAILCGGCQEVNEYSVFAFDALGNFSIDSNPNEAVRPFDDRRNGLVPSGGAACLVLEDLEYAKSRGAKIYGEIIGYGATSSGELVVSNLESQVACMKKALGNVSPENVSLVSAHATGTVQGDEVEADAIKEVFKHSPYISATKALTGHEMWMAGASEVIYSLLSAREGFIPPNVNTDDLSLGLNIHKDMVPFNPGLILSNSFGLGGTNSSLLIRVEHEKGNSR